MGIAKSRVDMLITDDRSPKASTMALHGAHQRTSMQAATLCGSRSAGLMLRAATSSHTAAIRACTSFQAGERVWPSLQIRVGQFQQDVVLQRRQSNGIFSNKTIVAHNKGSRNGMPGVARFPNGTLICVFEVGAMVRYSTYTQVTGFP